MAITRWSGVAVALGTLGAAQAVSAISKASTGVATYAGADPSNGSYFALTDVLGMYQVNSRVFRAANMDSGANTVELEGENTSSYDTFTSGNLQPVSFAYTMSSGVAITASGGDFDFLDTTTIHDLVRSQIPNVANPLTFSFDCRWDPSDTFLTQCLALTRTQSLAALRLTFLNGYKFLLLGYVGASLAPTGSATEIARTPIAFTAYGLPTVYTT